ncbi:MAG: GNVR domain-containing protein [Candidatus Omnitrophota bacterium]
MPQYELNLRDYIRIFRKRKLLIISTVIIITAVSVFFSMSKTVVYESITTIKVEERKTIAGLLTEWIAYSPGDTMQSQAKLITGYPVIKKTALMMRLIDGDSSELKTNSVINTLQGQIKTEQIGNTNLIRIIATSQDPEYARELANAVASVYIEENLLDKTKQARAGRSFIQEQIVSLQDRLQVKENKLKELSDDSRAITLAEPIQEKLTELQFALNKLLQQYTEKHPNVIQLKEEIANLEKTIEGFSETDLIYSRLKREVEADRKLFDMLKEKLEEARITEAQKIGDVSLVDPAVTAVAISAPNQILGFLVGGILGIVLGFAFALISESLDTSIATIEDVESLMKVSVLGVIPSVLWNKDTSLKRTFFSRFRKQILRQPQTEAEEKYIRLIAYHEPTSPITESYRNIYTNLKIGKEKKTILITSTGPREGKSSVLVNLGLVIAQSGLKVLLVSSDIRRPVICKSFGLKREPGLTEALLGMVPLNEALRNISDYMLGDLKFEEIMNSPGLDNLWVLTSGKLPFNPAKILESKELENLIEELKANFDLMLFDSPPVLPVTDASILSTKIDQVIVVYEIGRTSRDALLRAKSQLDSVGAQIAGVVLNQTRHDMDASMIYPYNYKYRYYESIKEDEQAKPSPVTT